MDDYFLMSREWKVVRMQALERDGGKCACCGRTAKDGITINVDHIKPRIRYPELALTVDNLQVLCNECNHGKGNKYETDWRQQHQLTATGLTTYLVAGDRFGRMQAWRKLAALLCDINDDQDAAFAFLPDGVDPVEFSNGDESAIKSAESFAVPWMEFLLAELCARNDMESSHGRARFQSEAETYVESIRALGHKAKLQARIAKIVGGKEAAE